MFFAITGKVPIQLLYEGSKPHQIQEVKQKLSALPEHILSRINRVFDRAFEYRIDYRWQSIPALKNSLIDIFESENQEYNQTEVLLDETKYQASTDIEKQLFENLAQKIIEKIYDIVDELLEELGSGFGGIISGGIDKKSIIRPKIDWDNLTFSQSVLGIRFKRANKSFFPGFEGYMTGHEVVLVYVEHYIPTGSFHSRFWQ
ncbi:MAG: hypothetical protein QNJ68_21520 [Microcoleaceae cyanobacterium MO_207.B10]|nr:hypothetical protein [Microcoleaceae cyanobacterium MO_207.B10]